MRLKQLLENVDVVSLIDDAEINDICTDCSSLKENSLFLITDEKNHKIVPYSNNMLQSAISYRTGFILWDSENWPTHEGGAESFRYIDVKYYRKSCAQICSNFYGQPSKSLVVIGVTGTNGKTSTSCLVERILQFSQLYRPLLIGTLNTRCGNVDIQPSYTTPYCDVIPKLLHTALVEHHADSVVMEVSSRGLDQERVGGIAFDVSIYTNLTQDHISYHGTFDEYKRAKTILFEDLTKKVAIINRDDDCAQHFIDKTKKTVRVLTYGILRNHETDIYADNIQLSVPGLSFDLHIPAMNITEHIRIERLTGKTNVYNSLAALACAHLALNIPLDLCKQALVDMPPILGRLELVTAPKDPVTVIIDSAHTPDGFKEILSTLRDCIAGNNLICLFSCRDNADQLNRPLLAAVAQQLSDKVIVTTDNSQCEDSQTTIQDILVGFSSASTNNENVFVEIDRRQAIQKVISSIMQDNDILIIFAKRHNINRMIRNRQIDFDDRIVVRECIQQRIQHNAQ